MEHSGEHKNSNTNWCYFIYIGSVSLLLMKWITFVIDEMDLPFSVLEPDSVDVCLCCFPNVQTRVFVPLVCGGFYLYLVCGTCSEKRERESRFLKFFHRKVVMKFESNNELQSTMI